MSFNLITLLGPTASGKTQLAAKLSADFNCEIISADSRQVYKGMNIGTGKDYDDYIVDGEKIPYHLIDIADPHEEYNIYLFKKDFFEAYEKIRDGNKTPFLVGGSGLYLSAVLQNYKLKRASFDESEIDKLKDLSIEQLGEILMKLNPSLHNTTDLLDKERIIKAIIVAGAGEDYKEDDYPKISSLTIGINLERNEIKKRITQRLKVRLKSGMIEEVKDLIKHGLSYDKLNFFGLEYKFIGLYLKGELSYNDMFQKLNSAIHGFAKRQLTWLRKMEREGVEINWIEGADYDKAREIIENKFSK